MYERYMLRKEEFKNVLTDGTCKGFEFKVSIPYYRGVMLSMIHDFRVTVNGLEIEKDRMTFTVGGHTYTFEEMETMTTLRWEFGERATVYVPYKNGLNLGTYKVDVEISIRKSYGGIVPEISKASILVTLDN